MKPKVDNVDRAILKLLQEDVRMARRDGPTVGLCIRPDCPEQTKKVHQEANCCLRRNLKTTRSNELLKGVVAWNPIPRDGPQLSELTLLERCEVPTQRLNRNSTMDHLIEMRLSSR